jgi:hypothetical protein
MTCWLRSRLPPAIATKRELNCLALCRLSTTPIFRLPRGGGAVELFLNIGDADEAAEYRNRFATVLRTLARNFEPDDPLHKSLLTALATRTARWDAMTSARPSGTSE